jgi:hypothetical protein
MTYLVHLRSLYCCVCILFSFDLDFAAPIHKDAAECVLDHCRISSTYERLIHGTGPHQWDCSSCVPFAIGIHLHRHSNRYEDGDTGYSSVGWTWCRTSLLRLGYIWNYLRRYFSSSNINIRRHHVQSMVHKPSRRSLDNRDNGAMSVF